MLGGDGVTLRPVMPPRAERCSIGLIALAFLFGSASPGSAQCTQNWRPDGSLSSLNGPVYATAAWDPDGAGPQSPLLIVGGNFTAAGPTAVANIAAWNGTGWQPLGPGLNGTVLALGIFDGQVIAGGQFTAAGGASASRVAAWNGTAWQPIGGGVDGTVASLTLHAGDLIVGGLFTSAGGAPANSIARWDGAAWHPLGAGVGGSFPYVQALASYAGNVIAGGLFTSAGGTGINCLAQWDGATWQPLGSGIPGFAYVVALAVFNNTLIAGGQFPDAGGSDAHNIAQWNGTSWSNMGGRHMNSVPLALTVFDGALIVGGNFNLLPDGSAANRIAWWNGSVWQPLGSGTNDDVQSLAGYEGYLIAGGAFLSAGGNPSPYLARWGPVPPTVSIQLADHLVCEGGVAGFQVSATGVGPLTYQWRRGNATLANGGSIAGADTSNLVIDPATPADAAADYNCVVIDSCGGRTISSAVTLDVTPLPVGSARGPYAACETAPVALSGIASHAAAAIWTTDGSGTFSDANSLTATYTPSEDDVIAGTVVLKLTLHAEVPCAHEVTYTTTLAIRRTPTADAGGAYVVCADTPGVNIAGSASDHASVAWTSSGDGTFIDATSLATSYVPGPADIASGAATLTLTAAPIAPCSAPAASAAALTIAPPPQGDAGGPYVTCAGDAVTLVASTANDTGVHWSSNGTGVFDDPAARATTYTPGAEDAAAGSVLLTLTIDPVSPCMTPAVVTTVLEIRTDPDILLQPVGGSVGVGGLHLLSVSAAGGGLSYQWFKDGSPIPAAIDSTYPIGPAQPDDAGAYTCLVSNDCGFLLSDPAVLSVFEHATLTLETSSSCVAGDQVIVSINIAAATSVIVGGQFFLQYETSALQFVGAAPGDPPFVRQVYLAAYPDLGTIDYAVGIGDGDVGTTAAVTMARLTFNVLTETCEPVPGLVAWRAAGPGGAVNKLSNDLAEPVFPITAALPPIRVDQTAPVLASCPADLAVQCPDEIPAPAALTADDNCDGSVLPIVSEATTPGPCANAFTLARTWTVTDACSNSAACTQLIVVNDTTAPLVGEPPPIGPVYPSQASAEAAAGAAALIAAGDNCAGPLTAEAATTGQCPAVITVTVADACGNVSNAVQFSTRIDEAPPVITGCPADVLTNVDGADCTATVSWTPPEASDACTDASIAQTGGPAPGSTLPNGSVTTIEYTATDAAGNSSTCTFTIAVAASPDLNDDHVVDPLDMPYLIDVLLGLDATPWRVARADANCDGRVDGRDIQPFLGLALP